MTMLDRWSATQDKAVARSGAAVPRMQLVLHIGDLCVDEVPKR